MMEDAYAIAARQVAEFDLTRHLDYIGRRLMSSKKDVVYLMDGEEGSGKSTLGRLIGRKLGAITGTGFSVKPVSPDGDGGNILYPGQCYVCAVQGIRYLPAGSWVQVDEALKTLHSRGSMRRTQIALMQFFAMARIARKAYGMIGGNFRWFDPFIRDHRGKYRIKTYEWQEYDDGGKLWDRNGKARIWAAKKPDFGKVIFWDKLADFLFEDDLAPDVPEYEYYKEAFSLGADLGYEFDWHAAPYEEGAKVPSPDKFPWVDHMANVKDAPSMPSEDLTDEGDKTSDDKDDFIK